MLTPGKLILALPSNETPPIVLAVASFVAVAAFPVVDPDVPDTFPVTLPVRSPVTPPLASILPANVETPDTTIPFLAVIKPTESMLVTSSYVNVPPIERLPDMVALVACRVPIVPTPDTFKPVVIPVILIPLLKSTGVLNLSVVPVPALIPVSADPSIAGNADGNLASGIVPELRFDAFKLVKFAPDPSESNNVPAEFGKTTVGLPEN